MRRVVSADRRARSRFEAARGGELRAIIGLAAPLAAANLAQMAMGVTNTVMVGRLGAMPLAAAGLGGMFYFTGGIILQGVLFAITPLVAHALGEGDRLAAGRVAGAGLLLACMFSLPFAAALSFSGLLLGRLGYEPRLAAAIGEYLRVLAWGAPAFLAFAVMRGLFAAFSQARAVMIVVAICVGTNALINWALIFGRLGAPALGVVGSGYASAINQWLMLGGLALWSRALRGFSGLHMLRHAIRAGGGEFAAILRLGLPMGAIRGVEAGLFTATGVVIGLLGAAALGAHQLVINCASVSFMVPLGLSQAATVRVAYQLGAGRPYAARRAGFAALALGVGFMAGTAIVLLAIPDAIIAVYVDSANPANRELVHIARQLIMIAALFQVFDGMQTIAAGILRGYKDAVVPLLLAGLGYWGVGFLGGWILAFPLHCGAVGLWWGLALGLVVVAVMLCVRFHVLATPRQPAVRLAATC